MKNNVNDFVEEITTNFSELFVETFFLRYLSDFKKDELLEITKIVKNKLDYKINKKLFQKLKSMGYNEQDIKF